MSCVRQTVSGSFFSPAFYRWLQDLLLSEGAHIVKINCPGFSVQFFAIIAVVGSIGIRILAFLVFAIIAFYGIGRILVLLVFRRHHRFLRHRQDIGFFWSFFAIIAFYSISRILGLISRDLLVFIRINKICMRMNFFSLIEVD